MVSKYTVLKGGEKYLLLVDSVYQEIYAFLDSIDAWKLQTTEGSRYKDSMQGLQQHIKQLLRVSKETEISANKTIERIMERIDRVLTTETSDYPSLFQDLIPLYVQLSSELHRLHRPTRTLRYSNTTRSIFHGCTAAIVITTYKLVLDPTGTAQSVSLSAALMFWAGEYLKNRSPFFMRLMQTILGPCARQHEFATINSATWYTTALAVMAFAFPTGPHSMIALAVLGLGDPFAALFGKKYGTHRFSNGKSVQGLCGFILAATFAAILYQLVFLPDILVCNAVVAAIAGGIAEVISDQIDDNFTIPLAAASASWILTTIG